MRSLTSVLSICLIFGVTGAFAAKGGKGGGGSSTAGPVTYQVNCNLGERISDVLTPNNDQPITVEFSGTCNEDVGIAIPRVTLRGVGTSAAIRGENRTSSGWDGFTVAVWGVHGAVLDNFRILPPSISNENEAGLRVWAGGSVRLENMYIRDCYGHGVGGYAADISLKNTTIENCNNGMDLNGTTKVYGEGNNFINNRRDGIAASGGASVSMRDSLFDSNGRNGFQVWNGASGDLRRVVVTNNVQEGIVASLGSSIAVEENSTVSGNGRHGIYASRSSGVWISNNVVSEKNGRSGVRAETGASIAMQDSISRDNLERGVQIIMSSAYINRSEVTGNTRQGIEGSSGSIELNEVTVSSNGDVGVDFHKGTEARVENSIVEDNARRQISIGTQSSLDLRSTTIRGSNPMSVWFDSALRSNGGNTFEATATSAVNISEQSSVVFTGNLGPDQLLGDSTGSWSAGLGVYNDSGAEIREVVIRNFVGPALDVNVDSAVRIRQGRFESSGNMAPADVQVSGDSTLKLLDAASSMSLTYGISCGDDGRVKNYAALTPFVIEESCFPQP